MKLNTIISPVSPLFSDENIPGSGYSPDNRSYLLPPDICRPDEAIRRLHDALRPAAEACELPPRKLIPGEDRIWLVTTGHFRVYRRYDGLKLRTATGPALIGLQELFGPFGRHYFRFSRGTGLSSVPLEQAREVMDRQQLWQDVAEVLAYYLRIMTYRDEHMVSKKTYVLIRVKLIEYMAHRDIHISNRTGIVSYIQNTTMLSRSLIYHVLSSLTRGGYISMSGGKLDAIHRLPEAF